MKIDINNLPTYYSYSVTLYTDDGEKVNLSDYSKDEAKELCRKIRAKGDVAGLFGCDAEGNVEEIGNI